LNISVVNKANHLILCANPHGISVSNISRIMLYFNEHTFAVRLDSSRLLILPALTLDRAKLQISTSEVIIHLHSGFHLIIYVKL